MKNQHWKTYKNKVEVRVDKLLEEENYLEIILWFSNILEAELKDIIIEHQTAIKFICQKERIKFKRLVNKDLEKSTLGQLKNRLEIFVKKDLIKEISEFNKLRVKVMHNFLDSKADILENEARRFIPRFYVLMEKLADVEISIVRNLYKYKQRKRKK